MGRDGQPGMLPAGGAIIYLRGGIYLREKQLELGPLDSGNSSEVRVVWRNYPGEEVRILGAKQLTAFSTISDPKALGRIQDQYETKILQADLAGVALDPHVATCHHGDVSPTGFGLELIFENEPMRVARWPNDGWAVAVNSTGGLAVEYAPPSISVGTDRPATWPATPSDMWVEIYTAASEVTFERVASIDASVDTGGTITTTGVCSDGDAPCITNGDCTPGNAPGDAPCVTDADCKSGACDRVAPYCADKCCRWRALNLLEELDQPGEYYFDPQTQVLYFWPPPPGAVSLATPAFIAIMNDPLLKLKAASHVRIQGLSFEASRQTGIDVYRSEDIDIGQCVFRNLAYGVVIEHSSRSGVRDSTFAHINGGIQFRSPTAELYAEHNHIHHGARWCGTASLQVHGDRLRISNNCIHDAANMGIMATGDHNEIRDNELYDVVTEADDAGAIYLGPDAIDTILEANCFHDLQNSTVDCPRKMEDGTWATWSVTAERSAVYLDNCASEESIRRNTFRRVHSAVWLGGGHDNVISGNLFDEVETPLQVDARGSYSRTCLPPHPRIDVAAVQCPPLNNTISNNGVCRGSALVTWAKNPLDTTKPQECLPAGPRCPGRSRQCLVCKANWVAQPAMTPADPCINQVQSSAAACAASGCGKDRPCSSRPSLLLP